MMSIDEPKVLYTGYFLTNPKLFLEQIPPAHFDDNDRHYDDVLHITKEYMPESGTSEIEIGKKHTFYAIGQVILDGVHAVIISAPDKEVISMNEYPHITIVTANGVRPVISNDIITKAKLNGQIRPINPNIPFEAVEGYHDGVTIH